MAALDARHPEGGTIDARVARVRTASLAVLAGAIWLMFSAWIFASAGEAYIWNNLACATVIGVLSLARIAGALTASTLSWLNALLGIWIALSPIFTGAGDRLLAAWSNVVTGLLIAAMAAVSAASSPRRSDLVESRRQMIHTVR